MESIEDTTLGFRKVKSDTMSCRNLDFLKECWAAAAEVLTPLNMTDAW